MTPTKTKVELSQWIILKLHISSKLLLKTDCLGLPKQIQFTRHIFGTLTYSRNHSLDERWSTISIHFNRFMQSFRRLHRDNIAYLRVVEEHKDGYPHIHVLLQFPDARIRIENSRYFDKELYERWRLLWKHGHTDYQKPRSQGTGTLSYVLKYLIKNQTSKTIWKKCLPVNADVNISKDQNTTISSANDTDASVNHPTRLHGVKLASWSRNFDFSPFVIYPSKGSSTDVESRAQSKSLTSFLSN